MASTVDAVSCRLSAKNNVSTNKGSLNGCRADEAVLVQSKGDAQTHVNNGKQPLALSVHFHTG